MSHLEFGNDGETIAKNYLLANGYDIIDTNFKHKTGELDIIAENNGRLVVTEVKTRATDKYGEPYQAVSLRKQRQIIKVTNKYLEGQKKDWDVRFDVISIVKNDRISKIKHIKDAFYPLV